MPSTSELPANCRPSDEIRRTENLLYRRSSQRNHSPILAKVVANDSCRNRARVGGGRVASSKLQRFRETLMMSKAELARKSGLSTLTIDRVEAGRPCRLDTKRKILQALQLRISDHDRVFGLPEQMLLEDVTNQATGGF